MKCPQCVEEGERSIVTVNDSYVSTLMGGGKTFYDEDGVRHVHNPNVATGVWRCSRGHRIVVRLGNRCPGLRARRAGVCDYGEPFSATVAEMTAAELIKLREQNDLRQHGVR